MGIHFITPARGVRAVELIYADYTPSALVEWGRKFLDTIHHVGVACKERPGFLVNRLQYRYLPKYIAFWTRESPAGMTVDTATRLGIGPRLALWGPLLTEDLVVSKKTTVAVMDYLHQQTGDSTFAPRPVLQELVESGRIGAVSGKGWYEFSEKYDSVVKQRDKKLTDLLAWLQCRIQWQTLDSTKKSTNGLKSIV